MARVVRLQLLRALEVAEALIRHVAGRPHLPTRDRLDLLRIANGIAQILQRARFR